MGYTHYWTISSTEEWLKTWPELLIDTRRIIQAAKVPLTRDGEDDTGIPPEITEKRIELNGDVNNSHEPFVLKPYATEFEFCKTAGKEYDIVVTAILLRAKMLAGNAIDVSSDGDWDDWEEAQTIVKVLWPGEEVACPWNENGDEDDEDEEED